MTWTVNITGLGSPARAEAIFQVAIDLLEQVGEDEVVTAEFRHALPPGYDAKSGAGHWLSSHFRCRRVPKGIGGKPATAYYDLLQHDTLDGSPEADVATQLRGLMGRSPASRAIEDQPTVPSRTEPSSSTAGPKEVKRG